MTWRVHPDVPGLVTGDRGRLRQMVMNLVDNALKFTDRGEVGLEVDPESSADRDVFLHFVVRDTGIGIAEDKQAAILGIFEQADTSLTRRHGGAGLGLAIASRLAGLMDGRLWLESEAGRGSRFHFAVRLGLPPTTEAAQSEPSVRKQRVLLVEDSLVNQTVVRGLLEKEGHAVTVVENRENFLTALEAGEFDLVLLDSEMPGLDRLEATARVRACGKRAGRQIPIIALAAHAQEVDREQCLAAGMDGHVSEPLGPKALLEAMEAVRAAPARSRETVG